MITSIKQVGIPVHAESFWIIIVDFHLIVKKKKKGFLSLKY